MPNVLDEYEIRARLIPGLVLLLPISVVATVLGLREKPVIALLVAALSAVGGPVILVVFVRERGQLLQQQLFNRWGGAPTQQLIRNGPSDSVRDRRRAQVAAVLGLQLPSPEQEAADPAAAERIYESAIDELRAKTRDRKRFPLVFAENGSYSFSRNLLALRRFGMGVAVICLGVTAWVLARNPVKSDLSPPRFDLIVGLILCVAILGFWCYFPSERRARSAADAYAAQLLDSAYTF